MQSLRAARRALLLLCVLLAGCPVDTSPEEDDTGPPVTGDWSGGLTGLTLELSLVEHEGGNITGTGTVRVVAGTLIVAVDQGVHRHPNVALVLAAPSLSPLTLSGKFENDDEIRGLANGSGFSSEPFTLRRR